MSLIATDLDGTLLGTARHGVRQVSEANLAALHKLGERGVVRIVATGRSAFAARTVLPLDAPIDYLVASSGAGIIDWRTQEYLRTFDLEPARTAHAASVLTRLGLDFMVHDPIPDNHRFHYRRAAGCADFERRIALYREHCVEGGGAWDRYACQLLAVHDQGPSLVGVVASALPGFTVLPTTSPLDNDSAWIEVFPETVSKSQACAWIAARHGLTVAQTIAVGNDTNDLDLLRWAERPFVVANAHPSLLSEFTIVGAADADGFADVAAQVLVDHQ